MRLFLKLLPRLRRRKAISGQKLMRYSSQITAAITATDNRREVLIENTGKAFVRPQRQTILRNTPHHLHTNAIILHTARRAITSRATRPIASDCLMLLL